MALIGVEPFPLLALVILTGNFSVMMQVWCQEFSDRGADSSDEGARIRLSGYCKWQKSPKNSSSPYDGG